MIEGIKSIDSVSDSIRASMTLEQLVSLSKTLIASKFVKDSFFNLISKKYDTHNCKKSFLGSLQSYYENSIAKYSFSKTLIYKSSPVFLYDFYIDLDLRVAVQGLGKKSTRTIKTDSFQNILQEGKYMVITGSAGPGKTTLLKHLFLDAIVDGEYIPMFIELKDFKQYDHTMGNKKYDFIDFLLFFVQGKGLEIEKDDFIRMLRQEQTALFLDGFDEIPYNLRKIVFNDITSLTNNNKGLHILLTSRPNDKGFTSLSVFSELEVQSLTKDQAINLASKLKFNSESEYEKQRFIEELENDLFVKNEFFLSNLLLLNILILTYSNTPEIPEKSYLFYSRAYEALYSHHDSLKESFKRKRYCNLL